MVRNIRCGLCSLRCTCKWVSEHSTQQRQCFHPGLMNWHVSINPLTSSHCGAPLLTTLENEMGFSVVFEFQPLIGRGSKEFWASHCIVGMAWIIPQNTTLRLHREQNRAFQNRQGKRWTTYLPGQMLVPLDTDWITVLVIHSCELMDTSLWASHKYLNMEWGSFKPAHQWPLLNCSTTEGCIHPSD